MILRRSFLLLSFCLFSGCDSPPAAGPEVSAAAGAVEESAPAVVLPVEISFNEHIQPVLSEYCYHCHGPDAGTREPKEAPLRLDRPEDAFAARDTGKPVIIKGNPRESLLVKRLHETDPDSIMPPPQSHKVMGAREIALIERWIEQGAEFEEHWAFVPVKRPEPPVAGADWAANPIDRFIAEKQAEAGLTPNPPDDPRRLYRRMHLDLTGLPPLPDQLEAFAKGAEIDAPAAISRAADEMLATTASAEHFARHWLDAARYADTHGIHIDNYRAIWPYRDWVVNAFRENLPWDQFTTEQIAGDLLPGRTLDQLVATGFSRCLATTGEGGAIPEEYDAIYAKDRVETVSAIWLGLTTGCAACHDHKFDPISTREFYSLTAFFRNTPMSALDGNNAEHPPNVFVPAPADRERWAAIEAEISSVEKELAARVAAAGPDFEKWVATGVIGPGRVIDATLAIHLPLTEAEGPLRGTVNGEPREWPVELSRVEGPLGSAGVISATQTDLGDIGSFSRADGVTYGGFIKVEGTPTGAVVARMDPANSFRGWDLFLQDGRPAAHAIDLWDKAANKIVADKPLEPGKWHHVMITFDGSAAGHRASQIYVDGQKAKANVAPNSVGGRIEAEVPLRLGSRHGGDSALTGEVALQDFRFYRRLLEPAQIEALSKMAALRSILALSPDKRDKKQKQLLLDHFIAHVDPPAREIATRIYALKTKQSALRQRGSVSLVMEEKKDEPHAHVLVRGAYSDKGEKVDPATPAILPPMPADAPKNRLGLARWLNDPANPLPARVTMNRTWYYFFGAGIVETNDDFGIMGARPSHPALLDWLASEFISSGWDYRHMLKLMVTSSVYRQSGVVTPESLEKDPSNRFLARGPRHRLDAEQIRDLALSAADLLSSDEGGPPVKPYQPEGIWEAVAMAQSNTRNYVQDQGEKLYRRSLYTFWKRTAAPPSMEIFNAPSRETFCVRRDRTNTPLQALVLLNDPQFVEASRVLAGHAITASPDFDARLDFITARLIGRTFDADERRIVAKTLDAALADFTARKEDAVKLLETGAAANPENTAAPELAAWTLVASQILNLDETITR